MRVLVCGGRDYTDRNHVFATLNDFHREHGITTIINGGQKGADRLASSWANLRLIECRTFLANWAKYGRAAGPLRNKEMLKEGKPDIVIAFPGNEGTADMVERARLARVRVLPILPRDAD